MEDDQFAAAKKILLDIEMVFKKDPKLKEFDIIPVKLNENKSPVIHTEHCLGLESWCIRHLYCYCYQHIMDEKRLRHRREDPAERARWLLGAALLNPDNPSFWNARKLLVQSGRLEPSAELRIAAVALSRRPKCAEVFAQRRWLIEHMLEAKPAMPESAVSELVDLELEVSEACACRHGNNYHAWLHRAWVLRELAPRSTDPVKVLALEWTRSECWVGGNVSDGSGLHYRRLLVGRLADALAPSTPTPPPLAEALDVAWQRLAGYLDRPAVALGTETALGTDTALGTQAALAAAELWANCELLTRFEGHEALWAHRRAMLAALQDTLTRCPPAADDAMTSSVRSAVPRVEAALVARCAHAAQPYQRTLAAQHGAWLRAVLRIPTL